MKFLNAAAKLLPFALVAFVLTVAVLPQKEKGEEREAERVVRVWHVDTFEGGKGSRAAFLKAAAERAGEGGVYYLVTSYTPEGAKAAFAEGKSPDALSFGIGLSEFAESALPLPRSFAGGELGGECRAYPWCRGGYALFSLTDDFGGEGKTAISSGGCNLPAVSARLSGIEGEELPSLTAYTAFLNGDFRYLLGTQRDLCRFRARGISVSYRPLPAYCDLYQYFAVLSAERAKDCLALLDELLSERTQEKLSAIGMFPAEEENEFAPLPQRTAGAFLSDGALRETAELARSGGERKILEKYLKTI